ncbi:MAG: flagellar motor switch protein FliM, partial [Pseudolabrys sp.]|nr:flagellar motor switch protein FliM [Pseudolabrys sp.]
MAQKEQIDQDALAAEWGLALEADDDSAKDTDQPSATGEDAAAAQWSTMADEGALNQKGGAERILNQDEIDSLLGFSLSDININDNSGIRAIIDSAMVSYERLPMLEIVFDRLVRLMTTSLRNFTSDNV